MSMVLGWVGWGEHESQMYEYRPETIINLLKYLPLDIPPINVIYLMLLYGRGGDIILMVSISIIITSISNGEKLWKQPY
jgi:hypothetical protein